MPALPRAPEAQAVSTQAVAAGATVLEGSNANGFEGFSMGRKVIIGAGTPQEEINEIESFGSIGLPSAVALHQRSWSLKATEPVIVLKYPLQNAHPAGVKIEMLAEGGPGPAPAPAPGPMGVVPPIPRVHVAFLPGSKMKRKHVDRMINQPAPNDPIPKTVLVKVTLFDRPNNGVNDMQLAAGVIKQSLDNGQLKAALNSAIYQVMGVKPKIAGLKMKAAVVKAWDIPKCKSHLNKLVNEFTVHYTRRQVPLALYNECNNFVTKISFSHDYVLDQRDAARCRKVTRKFAQKWKLGKNDGSKDYEDMCVRFCEARYGNDAPVCHISAGDQLASQPL